MLNVIIDKNKNNEKHSFTFIYFSRKTLPYEIIHCGINTR
jgi:hypothetical protein